MCRAEDESKWFEKSEFTDQDICFLNYIYNNIAIKEYPETSLLLCNIRNQLTENQFFKMVMQMNTDIARKTLGFGGVQTRDVISMCNMVRCIAGHLGSRKVFECIRKTDIAVIFIKEKLKNEHIRIIHAYESFWESCDRSVVTFYMKVIVINRETVKFQGLNHKKSQKLYDIFKNVLAYIDKLVVVDDESHPEMILIPNLIKLGLNERQCNTVLTNMKKCGHFPIFTTLSYLFENMTNNRQKDIFRRSLNSVYGKPIEDLNNIATSLGLSRERVRQLREECYTQATKLPCVFLNSELSDNYQYKVQTEYDFNLIREEEGVDFSNEYITICISYFSVDYKLIGDSRKAMFMSSGTSKPLYLVSKRLSEFFDFDEFVSSIDQTIYEKRFFPYREDLEAYVRRLIGTDIVTEDIYAIVKECRQILQKGYPDNIINSQIYFPTNTRKTIPYLIEDILHEFNRPMTAEEISSILKERYPDLEQSSGKIGPNALRNSNIIAVSRTSTYALTEWDYTEKRGGTIRNLAEEYLNSLIPPIASLAEICSYISKFRSDIKENSVKANLWAESNRFSIYYKGNTIYIGLSSYNYDKEYILQGKNQGRRSFMNSIELLENFIKQHGRFPYSSVEGEEARLSRFYMVSKANMREGILSPDKIAEIERIDTKYGSLKTKKERVPWEERFERFVKHITENDSLPRQSSKEYAWYEENKALYDAGMLDSHRAKSFNFLVKIVERML
ncbi:MAG: hypothetical protein IK017_06250 [Paludibacteraceae bacterium]|nr:hypothetical protein [Paludibacteraceae bacterium]